MMKKIILIFLLIECISGFKFGNKSQKTFPKDFLFGVASSAYQIEGAWNVNGKSINSWDHFTHTTPEKILDGSNGDVACDSYHKLKEDVKLLKDLGVHFYRFSLSWTRILPSPFSEKLNPDGIRYYNELIDLLLENGIEPMVTIFHFDLPQTLQYLGGFTNPLIIKYFVKYAKFVFENFGDRVKIWTTFNEPHIYCVMGYGQDMIAPAYNLSGIGEYICSHNALKAHAAVYHLYNNTFRQQQGGKISINLDTYWYEPASTSKDDIEASKRALEFELGLYAHPIFSKTGDYPDIVKKSIAERSALEDYKESRLPLFTQEEINYIRGTHDNIFCLNHYSTKLTANKTQNPVGIPSFETDMNVNSYFDPSWPSTSSSIFKVVPWGIRNLLIWIKKQYGNPIVYITENGYAGNNEEFNDQERINFYKTYLTSLLEATTKHGVQVKRYTAWSLMDSYEWSSGYTVGFGMYHVDFNDPNRPRKSKASANYYKSVISNRRP